MEQEEERNKVLTNEQPPHDYESKSSNSESSKRDLPIYVADAFKIKEQGNKSPFKRNFNIGYLCEFRGILKIVEISLCLLLIINRAVESG